MQGTALFFINAKLPLGNNVNPEKNTQALHLVYILIIYATGGNHFIENNLLYVQGQKIIFIEKGNLDFSQMKSGN